MSDVVLQRKIMIHDSHANVHKWLSHLTPANVHKLTESFDCGSFDSTISTSFTTHDSRLTTTDSCGRDLSDISFLILYALSRSFLYHSYLLHTVAHVTHILRLRPKNGGSIECEIANPSTQTTNGWILTHADAPG